MQVIQTKYLGPTNTKGSRIKAYTEAHSVTVSYDYALNSEDNHMAAAKVLKDKLRWNSKMIGGHTEKGIVFMFEKDSYSIE